MPSVDSVTPDSASANHVLRRRFQTAVIGVGGCGGNAVDHLIRSDLQGVDFICVGTNFDALARTLSTRGIQLGSSGLSTSGNDERARSAAFAAQKDIAREIAGVQVLFIAAGMCGGTGSAATSVIASVARQQGILTIGVVTTPFELEGPRRNANASKALELLGSCLNMTLVVPNQKLLGVLGDAVMQDEAFAKVNDVLKGAVNASVDFGFRALCEAMRVPGRAMMGHGMAEGRYRVAIALARALDCPLLEDGNLLKSKLVMVKLTCARGSLQPSECTYAINSLQAQFSPGAKLIVRSGCDASLGEAFRVSVFATGM